MVEFVVLLSSLRRAAPQAIRAGHGTATDPPRTVQAPVGLV